VERFTEALDAAAFLALCDSVLVNPAAALNTLIGIAFVVWLVVAIRRG